MLGELANITSVLTKHAESVSISLQQALLNQNNISHLSADVNNTMGMVYAMQMMTKGELDEIKKEQEKMGALQKNIEIIQSEMNETFNTV